jgi:uncharacterized protein
MGIFRRNGERTRSVRIFFASDLHGSEVAFRKMLNSAKVYGVDVLICGGDIAGKRLYPVIGNPDGTVTVQMNGKEEVLTDEADVERARTMIANTGGYTVDVGPDQAAAIAADQALMERIFVEKVQERLASWIELADERLADSEVAVYMTGGNDDSDAMLAPLRETDSQHVIACEGRIVEIQGHPMASLGWSNETPWKTPRETDETNLERLIEDALSGLDDYERAIFNFHVPPKDSTLDQCPRLDTSVWPPAPIMHGGEVELFGAGSSAVAESIARCQPMLSLHGHIHESANAVKLGRTVAINPGSDYQDGALRGAIVSLREGKVTDYQLTRG